MLTIGGVFLLLHDRAGTNNIVKYNLQTEREEKQIGLPGPAGRPVTSGVVTLNLISRLTNKDYGPYGATVVTATDWERKW